jgi:hypothetical protein
MILLNYKNRTIMEHSKDYTINLENFRVKERDKISKVFTGRDRGKFVREQSNIDNIEKQYDKITIIIPDNVYSINPSFLEEFLINVVTKLGKDEFMNKFSFISEGDYKCDQPLEEAIDRILRTRTALN